MNVEAEEPVQHRIFGVFRAPETAALWLILVLLMFFGFWGWLEGNKKKPGLEDLDVAYLENQGNHDEFQLKVTTKEASYIAIYRCQAEGTPEQIFPTLGPPKDIAWHFVANQAQFLPSSNRYFRHLGEENTRYFVLCAKNGPPLLPKHLWQDQVDLGAGRIDALCYFILARQEERR